MAIDWQKIEKILIVRLRSIGDTVLTTPSLIALRKFLPNAQIDILLEDWVAPLLDGFESVDNVIKVSKSANDRVKLARKIRREKYDVAFNLHGGTTATFFVRASGAKHRIGFANYSYSFLYNHILSSSSDFWKKEKTHSAEQQLALLGFVGISVDEKPKTHLAVTQNALNSLQEKFNAKTRRRKDLKKSEIHEIQGSGRNPTVMEGASNSGGNPTVMEGASLNSLQEKFNAKTRRRKDLENSEFQKIEGSGRNPTVMEGAAGSVNSEQKTVNSSGEVGRNPTVMEGAKSSAVLNHNFALLHPVAAFDTKQWATENFARIAEFLGAKGFQILAVATKKERVVLDQLEELSKVPIVTFDDLSLPEITALASQAKLFVGNDSGIAHIAAAVKTPSVVIFGSSNREHWRPWTDAPNEIVFNELPCQPCAGYVCEEFGEPKCILSVKVENVVGAIEKVLEKSV